MKKTKKALASLAIAGMTLSMIPFNVFAASPVPTRLAGVTAEQTAVQIAEQTGYTGTAILASSTSYGMVDALTAGPLAASLKAPILLTGASSSLDAATKAELTKLAVKKVYVTSGTAVIKQSVIDELKGMGIEVEALGGFDRAATSVNIAKKMTGVTKVAVANTVVDALSIAAVASASNEPILLTDRDALPASVATYLASAGVTASDVIGGTGVISATVAAGLPNATRHYGMSAYDTNNQVIQDFAGSLQFDNVYVANGVTGIDALAGAPLAAQTKSPIVLTDGKTVPQAAAFTHGKKADAVVTALGGEFVVPESVRAGVAAGVVTPDVNELKIVSVSALDDTNRFVEINFSKAVSGLTISDITVENADTLDRYGVKTVTMSSNGMVATVELFAKEDADQVLETNQDYNVTVMASGSLLKATFNRPAYIKARISDIDPNDTDFTVGGVTINVPAKVNFDYAYALGREARVWYNQDRDLVKVAFVDATVLEDSIEVTKARTADEDGEIQMSSTDKKYSLAADNFAFYLNDVKQDIGAKTTVYDYAKVLFNKSGDVERIVAYDWDDFFVVKSLDGDVAIAADDTELDLEDYVVFKDGKQVKASDVKAGDIVYFDEDSNEEDGVAEIFNSSVTGEIEEVYADDLSINDKTYKYTGVTYNGKKTQFLDGDEFKDLTDSDAEKFQAGGKVTLFLDRDGNAVYLTGEQENIDSNTLGFHSTEKAVVSFDNGLTDRGLVELEGLNSASEEKVYSFRIDSLDTITNAAGKDFEDGEKFPLGAGATEIDKFALLDDGAGKATGSVVALDDSGKYIDVNGAATAVAANAYVIADLAVVGADNSFFEVKTNDSGAVKELVFYNSDTTLNAGSELKLDDKYVNGYRLLDDTVVFDGSEGWDSSAAAGSEYKPDPEDITVTTWGALKDKGFKISNATYYYNSDNEVEYLVIENSDAEDTTDFDGLVTKVLRNTDSEITSITAYVNGTKKTYAVDKVKDASPYTIVKGSTVELEINDDSDLVKDITLKGTTGVVATGGVDVAAKSIKVGVTTYYLASNASVYDATDLDNMDTEQLRNIKDGDTVTVMLAPNTTKFVDVVVLKTKATTTTTPTVDAASLTVPADLSADDIEVTLPTGNTDLYVVTVVDEDMVAPNSKNFSFTADGTLTEAQILAAIAGSNTGDVLTITFKKGTTVLSTFSAQL